MPNPRLAERYAKSPIGISQERKELEVVFSDMQFLQSICNSNKDLVALLRSPVVKGSKKEAIMMAITKGRINGLTDAFIKLLIAKGREADLPEIVTAFINQYDAILGIQKVKLTTAAPVSEAVINAIVNKLKASTGFDKIELEQSVKEELIGGFVLEYNNNLVDASVLRELKALKNQFQENVYVHNIR